MRHGILSLSGSGSLGPNRQQWPKIPANIATGTARNSVDFDRRDVSEHFEDSIGVLWIFPPLKHTAWIASNIWNGMGIMGTVGRSRQGKATGFSFSLLSLLHVS